MLTKFETSGITIPDLTGQSDEATITFRPVFFCPDWMQQVSITCQGIIARLSDVRNQAAGNYQHGGGSGLYEPVQ